MDADENIFLGRILGPANGSRGLFRLCLQLSCRWLCRGKRFARGRRRRADKARSRQGQEQRSPSLRHEFQKEGLAYNQKKFRARSSKSIALMPMNGTMIPP